MAAYIDASVAVAIELQESGHRQWLARMATVEMIAHVLLEAEVRAAIRRVQSTANPESMFRGFEWIWPARRLTPEIDRVLQAGYLRGADLWHVATALYASPDPSKLAFWTLDHDQREVARKLGFQVD